MQSNIKEDPHPKKENFWAKISPKIDKSFVADSEKKKFQTQKKIYFLLLLFAFT